MCLYIFLGLILLARCSGNGGFGQYINLNFLLISRSGKYFEAKIGTILPIDYGKAQPIKMLMFSQNEGSRSTQKLKKIYSKVLTKGQFRILGCS